jgi:transcriptional regulator with XRE-family HTH domain
MKYFVGKTIREIRKKQRMTMKEVAEKIGVSESLISQIENDKISPSIDTLLKIAEVLNIDFDYLFKQFKKDNPINIIHKNKRTKILRDGILYELLSKIEADDEHKIEAYYLEIKTGNKRENKTYGHNGWELGIILEGEAKITIGNQEYLVKPGDSFSFKADKPHIIENAGDNILKSYWIITPPKEFIM